MLNRVLPVLLTALAFHVQAARLEFGFDKGAPGETPKGFLSAVDGTGRPAEWKLAQEEVPSLIGSIESNAAKSVAARTVLAVKSFEVDEHHFPILLFTNEILGDFSFSTRFKITGGVVEPCAGIVFRAQNPSNFYVLRASTEGNLLWYKVVDGRSYLRTAVGVKLPVERDVWRELRVECEGSLIRCFLDGKLAIPPVKPGSPTNNLGINDTTFSRGMAGFWCNADTTCRFADASIDYTPRVPFIQVAVNKVAKDHPSLLGLQVYASKGPGLPVVIAGTREEDMGRVGTKTEQAVLDRGSIFYLKGDKAVEVTMPLRDRNGEVAAALKITLKKFKGETETTAVTRATEFKKEIEEQLAGLRDING